MEAREFSFSDFRDIQLIKYLSTLVKQFFFYSSTQNNPKTKIFRAANVSIR